MSSIANLFDTNIRKFDAEKTVFSSSSKSKSKTPQIVVKERENISELSNDESSENGDYLVVQYAGKCNVVYYVPVATSVNNDEMLLCHCLNVMEKNIWFLMKTIINKLVLNVYLKNFHHLKSNKD